MIPHAKLKFAASIGAIAGMLVATAASAQSTVNAGAQTGTVGASTSTPDTTGTDNDQAIVVTGSRIARPELATVQPTQVIGAQQIEERGYTNPIQALQSLPSFGPAGNSSVGSQSSFGPSQSFADFFGLGSQRTLTLVNGRRFVSSNTASIFGPVSPGSQVDLNNIPTTLIDRIDVVSVGGAPIYGSDAIAGTVNIVLKKNYEGLELGAQYGISQQGDAPDRRANILFGHNFADGRGNITVSGEWNQVRGFTGADRSLFQQGLFFGSPPSSAASPFARRLFPGLRYTDSTVGGVPFSADDYLVSDSGIRNAAGQLLQFGPNGTLVPLDVGTQLRQGYVSSGGNGYDIRQLSNILTDSDRYLGTALGSFEFSDHLRAFGEAWYSHSKGVNIVDQPVYNSATFDAAGTPDGTIVVGLDNPYLTAADRATIAANLPAGQNQFYLGRASADLTTGRSQAIVQAYRFVGGFSGDFGLAGRNVTWEVSGNYGHSRTDGRILSLVQQNFENATEAVTDASGNIVCRPGYQNAPIATGSATCAPLDILGSGQASQAAKDYIFTTAKPRSTNSQLVFNANAQIPLFKLPGGDLKTSLGYEYRREGTNFDPGAFFYGEPQADGSRVQYGRSIPIDPINGHFHTNEVFGEVVAPIVSRDTGLRFLKTLELDGSARYVKNSLAGGDVTWTAGGRLGFVNWLTFRGNFTHSIRNPAVTEVFNPTSQAFDSANDPCDSQFVVSGPNPAQRRANCVAAGIADPSNFTSNIVTSTARVSISGNRNLSSETANSWTAGAVFQPSFVRGFTASVDWVNIELTKAILSLGGTDLMNACYDAANYPNQFCGAIDRDPTTHQVTFLREGYYNAASYLFRGLQVSTSYVRTIDAIGTIGVDVNYLYRQKLQTRVGTGDINHLAGEIGYPHHGFTANLNYRRGDFFTQLQGIYVGKGRFDIDDAPNARDIKGVGDWVVFNGTVGVDVAKNFSLDLIVDNIANRKPPFPFTASYNATNVYYEGIVGRSFTVSAKARF